MGGDLYQKAFIDLDPGTKTTFDDVRLLDGEVGQDDVRVQTEELDREGRPALIYVGAEWCEPCKREMPAFQGYWADAPDDVMFVGVGTDTKLKGVRVEVGYLNVVLRRDTQVDHAIALNVSTTLAP